MRIESQAENLTTSETKTASLSKIFSGCRELAMRLAGSRQALIRGVESVV
jgi:hypothetical protein